MMRNTISILLLFVFTLSFANENVLDHQNITTESSEVLTISENSPQDCSVSTTSETVNNPDGSSTTTTTTGISCDTAGELATLHQLMKAIGMGI